MIRAEGEVLLLLLLLSQTAVRRILNKIVVGDGLYYLVFFVFALVGVVRTTIMMRSSSFHRLHLCGIALSFYNIIKIICLGSSRLFFLPFFDTDSAQWPQGLALLF